MNFIRNFKLKIFFLRIAVLVVSVFSVVLLLGLSAGMDHSTGSMSNMNCIFDDGSGCDMTLDQHLSFWQQFFTANVFSFKIELVFLAGLFFVAFLPYFSRKKLEFFRLWKSKPLLFYERRNSDLRLFEFIANLLSAGILQPKLYQPERVLF